MGGYWRHWYSDTAKGWTDNPNGGGAGSRGPLIISVRPRIAHCNLEGNLAYAGTSDNRVFRWNSVNFRASFSYFFAVTGPGGDATNAQTLSTSIPWKGAHNPDANGVMMVIPAGLAKSGFHFAHRFERTDTGWGAILALDQLNVANKWYCDRQTFTSVTVTTQFPWCDYGFFQDGTTCYSCYAGQYLDVTYTLAPLDGSYPCKHCPAGRFAASTGARTCDPCPRGRYQDWTGQSSCKSCRDFGERHFQDVEGSTTCKASANCRSCQFVTLQPSNPEYDICGIYGSECLLKNSANQDTCYGTGNTQGSVTNSFCFECQPGTSQTGWTFMNLKACNDQDACTHTDRCTNSVCAGTLYQTCLTSRWTSNSLEGDCEDCNGAGGCTLRGGWGGTGVFATAGSWGGTRKCGCFVDSAVREHLSKNPANQCQKCDLAVSRTSWTNYVNGVACNDGVLCTYNDICNGAGGCGGTAKNCLPEMQICHKFFPQYPEGCDGTSVCNFDLVTIADNKICNPKQNECQLAMICGQTGLAATCAAPVVVSPIITTSGASLQLADSGYVAFAFMFNPSLSAVYARFQGFQVACDVLMYRWAVVQTAAATPCSTALASAPAPGNAMTAWTNLLKRVSNSDRSHYHTTYSYLTTGGYVDPSTVMQVTKSGLSLSEGTEYRLYMEVRNHAGSVTPFCSSTFRPDVTPPVNGWVIDLDCEVSGGIPSLASPKPGGFNPFCDSIDQEGLTGQAADIDFGSKTTVSFFFDTFSDSVSNLNGLLRYEYCVDSKAPGGSWVTCGAVAWSAIDPSWSGDAVMVPGLAPQDLWMYRVNVRATNYAGYSTLRTSDGYLQDVTFPYIQVAGNPSSVQFANGAAASLPVTSRFDVDGSGISWQNAGTMGASAATTVSLAWNTVVDLHSGIRWCHYAVGTAQGAINTVPWTQVSGDSVTITGLSLLQNTGYWVTLRCENWARLKSFFYSRQIRVDLTVPVANHVKIVHANPSDSLAVLYRRAAGFNFDTTPITHQSFTNRLGAAFSFSDTFAPIHSYDVAVGTAGSAEAYVAYTTFPPTTSLHRFAGIGNAFANHANVLLTVRGRNFAGLTFTQASQLVYVDTTPPDVGPSSVRDIDENVSPTNDVVYSPHNFVKAKWDGLFSDVQAGLSYFEYAVGSNPAGGAIADVQAFRSVDLVPWAQTAPAELTLFHNTRYYVTVRAWSQAELYTQRSTDGVLLDYTDPTTGLVFDGNTALVDVDWYPSTTTLVASWGSTGWGDPESGLYQYHWAISTCDRDGSPLGASTTHLYDILPWESVGTATMQTKSGLPLVLGSIYCVSVRWINNARRVSQATSDSVMADDTVPVVGYVHDGPGSGPTTDIDYQSDGVTIRAHWGLWFDPESLVEYYAWCISTTLPSSMPGYSGNPAGVCDVRGLTNIGNVTSISHTFASGVLQHDREYYVTLVAVNRATIRSWKNTDGVVVDLTPPSVTGAGFLAGDRSNVHAFYQPTQNQIYAQWSGFVESENHSRQAEQPLTFFYKVGTSVDGAELIGETSVGRSTAAWIPAASLPVGVPLFVTVVVENESGQRASLFPRRVIIDPTAPVAGQVTITSFLGDGSPDPVTGVVYSNLRDSITVSWANFVDAESTLSYWWALGTSANGSQVVDWTSVGSSTTATRTGLSLTPGGKYFVTVIARNMEGLGAVASAVSIPIIVDTQPPRLGPVVDGPFTEGLDVDLQTRTDQLVCSWGQAEDGASGLKSYEIGVGTAAGTANVVPFEFVALPTGPASVPMTATFAFGGSSGRAALVNGNRYHCVVRVKDRAGFTSVGSSDGVSVLTDPPATGVVQDGSIRGQDLDFQAGRTSLSATWTAFTAPGGVGMYDVAVGTHPQDGEAGQTDVVPWRAVGDRLSVQLSDLSLSHGATYYVCVRGWNVIGTSSVACSDGVKVDERPPEFSMASVSATVLQLGRSSVPSRTTCACADPHAVFHTARAVCECASNYYMSPTNRTCVPCPAGQCTPGPGLSPTRCGACSGGATPSAGGEPWEDAPYFSALAGAGRRAESSGSSSSGSSSSTSSVSSFSVPSSSGPSVHGRELVSCAGRENSVDVAGTCLCAPGFYGTLRSNGVECALCPYGTFKAGAGDDVALCRPCWFSEDASSVVLAAEWSSVSDADSFLSSASLTIGTTLQGAQIEEGVTIGGGQRGHVATRSLPHASKVVVGLDLKDAADVSRSVRIILPGVDRTPPVTGSVWDGLTNEDASVFVDPTQLTIQWRGFLDGDNFLALEALASGTASLSDVRQDEAGRPSAVRGYSVAFGTAPGQSDVSGGWVDVGLASSYTLSAAPGVLQQGVRYYGTVRAHNDAGLYSEVSSDGVVLDVTGPALVSIEDAFEPGSSDRSGSASTSSAFARWAFVDAESGVAKFEWAVAVLGTPWSSVESSVEASASVPLPLRDVGLDTRARAEGLSLEPGTWYVACVRATNVYGLATHACSNGWVVDVTPPVSEWVSIVPVVPSLGSLSSASFASGPSGPVAAQSSTSEMRVQWAFVDGESSFVRYHVSIGSTPVGQQGRTTVVVSAPATEAVLLGLSLRPGTTYYATVTAENAAGLVTTTVSSPFVIEGSTSVPQALSWIRSESVDSASVFESLAAEAGPSGSGVWDWGRAKDAAARLAEQGRAGVVGTASGRADVSGLLDRLESARAALVTDATASAVVSRMVETEFVSEVERVFEGRAFPEAVLASTMRVSQADARRLRVVFRGFEDASGGVVRVDLGVSSAVPGSRSDASGGQGDIVAFTAIPRIHNVRDVDPLAPFEGSAFDAPYFVVGSLVGEFSTVVETVVFANATAGGVPTPVRVSVRSARLAPRFTSASDVVHEVTVELVDPAVPWLLAPDAANYPTLLGWNGAGLWSRVVGASVSVDRSAPQALWVRNVYALGHELEADATRFDAVAEAAAAAAADPSVWTVGSPSGGAEGEWVSREWAGAVAWSFEDAQSEIAYVEWVWYAVSRERWTNETGSVSTPLAVGSGGADSPDVALTGVRWVPGTVSATYDTQPFTWLSHGDGVYAAVWAVNALGLRSAWTTTSLRLVDASPPTPGLVYHPNDGATAGGVSAAGGDVSALPSAPVEPGYTNENDRVQFVLVGFDDPESGLSHFRAFLGTSEGGSQLARDVHVSLPPSFSAGSPIAVSVPLSAGVRLPHGATVHVTLHAYNHVGDRRTVSRALVVVDLTAPEAGVVVDVGDVSAEDLRSRVSVEAVSLVTEETRAEDGASLLSAASPVLLDVDVQGSEDVLRVAFGRFYDPESGVVESSYEWGVGTGPGLFDVYGPVSYSFADDEVTELSLRGSVVLFTAAQGGSNASAPVFPNGTVLDEGAAAGEQRDAMLIESLTTIEVAVSPATLGLSSGLAHVYYASVRARNGAGSTRVASSDGVIVDASGPSSALVLDGSVAGVDADCVRVSASGTVRVSAQWRPFVDPESRVAYYEWAVGTSRFGAEKRGFERLEAPLELVVRDGDVSGSSSFLESLPEVATARANETEPEAGTTTSPFVFQSDRFFTPVTEVEASIGETLFVTVRATNRVGARTLASSTGMRVMCRHPTDEGPAHLACGFGGAVEDVAEGVFLCVGLDG